MKVKGKFFCVRFYNGRQNKTCLKLCTNPNCHILKPKTDNIKQD